MLRGNWIWRCNVKVTVWGDSEFPIATFQTHNIITKLAIDQARNLIRGEGSIQILQVGLGAGSAAVSDDDELLADERVRVDVIRQELVGLDGLLTTAYVAPYLANDFEIEEIGWFGPEATNELDSGLLMSRVLYNHQKNSLESLQIDRTDTFAEAP